MSTLKLYWIDAFTDRVFHGNPAAVVPLRGWPDDAFLQRIAFENGVSETAYIVPISEGRYQLRWFTPTVEVDLCGHATLASAHVIFHELGAKTNVLTFESRSGPLAVEKLSDGKLELDFPSKPATPAPAPELLTQGLRAVPDAVARTANAWLCVFRNAADVARLRPDFALLAQLNPGRVIVTAPGDDCDFVSRFFALDAGIPEDPVTGSAHCTLMPYWAQRIGRTKLHARQISTRGGELWCEQAGDRTKIAGHAVLYLRGEIDV